MSGNGTLEALEQSEHNYAQNADVRYLFAAALAHAKRYEEAVAEMTAAIELKPSLHTARLQLGLLHMTMAQPTQALSAWAPLEELEDDSALKLFKRGLEALIHEQLYDCVQWLEAGILRNATNPPLSRDMRAVIDRVLSAVKRAAH